MNLVDSCGWIEWLTDGVLAPAFAPYLTTPEQLVVPTTVQFELYKWVSRERDESLALEIVGLTQRGRVVPLNTALALRAGDVAREHKLAFADAVIYATALQEQCPLVTSDAHFAGLPGVVMLPKAGKASKSIREK